MEKVFEEHEMFERFNFSQMMLHYFKPCAPQKSQLSGMTATELYRLFLVHNPHSQLTSGIVHNILLMGGYVQRETGTEMELFAEINEEAFLIADRTIQMIILKHIVGPMEIKYRQIVLGIKIRKTYEDGSYEIIDNPLNSVTSFISRWTLNQNDRYHHYCKPAQRSTVLEVYNFYRFICVQYNMDIVSKKMFYTAVENMGYPIIIGSVHGKAGNRYFKNIYIPQDVNDIKLSLDINAVVIYNGRTHWTKDNELLENYTEALKEALKDENLRRMQFNERKSTKETTSIKTESSLDFRREIESIQTPISITEATAEERRKVEEQLANVKNIKVTDTPDKSSEVKPIAVERTSEDKQSSAKPLTIEPLSKVEHRVVESEHDSHSGTEEPRESHAITSGIARHIVKNSAAKRILAEFDPNSHYTESESGSSEIPSDSNDASFEEIAEAMKIPYKMNPASFTVDVFADWLDRMNIGCPDVRAYYKHIMPMIKE